jgi:hypothetical protein
MPTPASNQNEPSKMKKLISGQMDESIRAKLPPRNGSNPPRTPASPPPYPRFVTAPQPPRQEPRLKFLPAFWTIASLMSMTVNIILIVILLILFQMLGTIQDTAGDQASGLLGGLYTNFVRMDQAHIRTNIHVEKEIPVQFSLNVSGPTNVTLSQPVTINGALVTVQTGGLNITNARATIVLPQDTLLPINIQNLVVPVDQKVLAVLDVPVDIPLNQTELHEPFVGLQKVVEPWYCLIEPNAMFNGMQVCPQMTSPMLPTPTPFGTVLPPTPEGTVLPP